MSKEEPAEGGEDASEEGEPAGKYWDFLGVVLVAEPLMGLVEGALGVAAEVGMGEDLRREDCREEGVRAGAGAEEVLGVVVAEEAS